MDFKTFMHAIEQEIENFKSESELKEWLKNYARTINECERKDFLKQFGKRGRISHEEDLQNVLDWCQKVNDAELTLSSHGYEEYGDSYWDRDWVEEYEDPCGIGKQIEEFYQLAEQCVYDKDYKSASLIYWNIGMLSVLAEDECAGDSLEMEIEDLVREGILSVDLKKIAASTLYSTYQDSKPIERVTKLYELFSWEMFHDVSMEAMMSVGVEPLEQVEEFMDLWIDYLRGQEDQYTARLLKEAVMYRSGTEGLLAEAKRSVNVHPTLFVEVLEKYYESESWEKLYKEGKEALCLMDRDMKIRGTVARLTAAGARVLEDREGVKAACTEAFYSEMSEANYMRLITCAEVTEEDKLDAIKRLKSAYLELEKNNKVRENYCMQSSKETDSYKLVENTYVTIRFFAGSFDIVLDKCKSQKEALGWTGQYIRTGTALLLILLFRGEEFPKAMQGMLKQIKSDIGYNNHYNEPQFEELLEIWKKQVRLKKILESEILEYLVKTIDARVEAIVSGGHRNSYYKAAELGTALGEVEESMGKSRGKVYRTQKYLAQFPRHRAFKSEINTFL